MATRKATGTARKSTGTARKGAVKGTGTAPRKGAVKGTARKGAVKGTGTARKGTGTGKSVPVKAGTATSKPGIISEVKRMLLAASEKKPISKSELLAGLRKAFPSRDPSRMAATISAQVPGRIAREQGIEVYSMPGEEGQVYFANSPKPARKGK